MGEDGALGYAGCSAGILKKSDIMRADVNRPQRRSCAFIEYGPEAGMAGQRPCRYQLLHLAHDQIDDMPFDAQHVAHRRNDDIV